MARKWFVAALLLIASACAHPHDAVIPVDPAEWDGDIAFQIALRRLSASERALLGAWLCYAEFVWPRGAKIVPGTTIRQALAGQRDFQREEGVRRLLEKKLGRDLPIIRTRPVIYRLSKPSHGSL